MQDTLNKKDMRKLLKIQDLLKKSLMIPYLELLVENIELYKKVIEL
jgi:ribosomal 30S subunit maturation factor RimM